MLTVADMTDSPIFQERLAYAYAHLYASYRTPDVPGAPKSNQIATETFEDLGLTLTEQTLLIDLAKGQVAAAARLVAAAQHVKEGQHA